MASIIISDELEISKMDTEAIYAAIDWLTLGHEELLGAGFVRRVAPVDNEKYRFQVVMKSKWCSWVNRTDKRTCVRCRSRDQMELQSKGMEHLWKTWIELTMVQR
ncbi:hypothetical protein CAEBREN_12024 [Caenorhabditis brenneri]|uniref:Uncharacterized protein n=1 Tax=Caenorhabditis brenneri TaxID=135651 RepID=G0P774_CAEBE|nr:hypothetical protein CAEBREN_12024 [Caenorhabditis brenneri]